MAIELECNDPWYQKLEEKYGYDFCTQAGYFVEYNNWHGSYGDKFQLPDWDFVIQYSGAFYPFHEGHLETIKKAIDELIERIGMYCGVVVLHVDHHGYRASKGSYPEDKFHASFDLFKNFLPYRGWKGCIIFEDEMEKGCSRNFTRLYSELSDPALNSEVYFLCGGDRANYALTFIDEGRCIVAGRSDHDAFKFYKLHCESDRCIFIDGNNTTSSTKIRQSINNSL